MNSLDSTVAWQVVLVLVVLVGLAEKGLSILRARRRDSAEREGDFVTQKHFGLVEERWRDRVAAVETLARTNSGRIEGLNSTLNSAIRELRAEIKADNKILHDRIDLILQAVSELKGESKHFQPQSLPH